MLNAFNIRNAMRNSRMLRDVVSSSICRATRRRTPSCPVPDVLIPPSFLMELSAAIGAMDALDRFQSSPAVHE